MKSYSAVIKDIKNWTRGSDLRKYLFVSELARGRMGTDNEDDLYCNNESVFDAFFDIRALQESLKLAKKRYLDKGNDEYVKDLFVGDERY